MVLFYGITFLLSLRIKQKNENVDGYMVSNGSIGFGMSAASMTATWIWAASFYAAASSGYTYGVSGALHYGLWGALMILFIYPFGKRFRELAPNAHTCPHPGRNYACPAWQPKPDDSGRFQYCG